MINVRLTKCADCEIVPSLLADIDCKLTELANDEYNNIIFSLNNYTPANVINDLINYKLILTYRLCNPHYACKYSTKKIASRVKVLIYK